MRQNACRETVGPEKRDGAALDTDMTWIHFSDWILDRRPPLVEMSGEFPKAGINRLFNTELERLIAQVYQPQQRTELAKLRNFDWCGYIDRAARNGGFRDFELDEVVHDIAVKLLMGGLFRDWNGQPLDRRFKASVKNALINMAAKHGSRRRWLPAAEIEPDDVAGRQAPDDEEAIEEFRRLVRDRLGNFALAVLDERINGGETKALIGSPHLGYPTSHKLKTCIRAIKALAVGFGDHDFRNMVRNALDRERETVQRRFAVPARG